MSVCPAHADFYFWWDIENLERYINKYEDSSMSVIDIRKYKKDIAEAMSEKKTLKLISGDGYSDIKTGSGHINISANILKTPDNKISYPKHYYKENNTFLQIPEYPDKEGAYTLCSHIFTETVDYNNDGRPDMVHYYPKAVIGYYTAEKIVYKPYTPELKTSAIPLEIVQQESSRYIGTIQISHRDYRMKVLFRGRPMRNATVKIITETGWQKIIKAEDGNFTVNHPESRGTGRNWEKYLYIADYYDSASNEYHVATFQMVVDPPWPEWRSYQDAFVFWAVTGSVLFLLLILLLIIMDRRKRKQIILKFGKGIQS